MKPGQRRNDWTLIAIIDATKSAHQWKVERNQRDELRCSCPAFVFASTCTCGHPKKGHADDGRGKCLACNCQKHVATLKTCKHTDYVRRDREWPPVAGAVVTVHVKPQADFTTMALASLLRASMIAVAHKPPSDDVLFKIAARMGPRLEGATIETRTTAMAKAGVRKITFDD